MKKNLILYLSMVLIFSAINQSCKKDNFNPINEKSSLSEVPEGYFKYDHQPNGFSDRITFSNKTIVWENNLDKDSLSSNSATERSGNDYSDYFWLHVGDVAPFELEGEILSATHIDFFDEKAYVSYHKRGNTHLGALEVIDLSDPSNPIVTFSGYLSNADINAVTAGKNGVTNEVKVWLALSDSKKGAVLGEVSFENGTNYNGFSIVNLSNYIEGGITSSANSIAQSGDYLYVSSGKTYGGAFCLNAADLSVAGSTEFQNGKYMSLNGSNGSETKVVSLQTGPEASLRVEDIGSFHFATEHSVGSILHQNVDVTARGKSTMHFVDNDSENAYVTMGMDGLKSFNIYTGQETWSSPEEMITSGNTNGVTSDGEFIYVANGADGLSVFTQPQAGESPEFVYHWDLDDATTASANFVQTHDEWVFVAKGQGGVKILKRPQPSDYLPIDSYDSNGVPDNLAPNQETCNTLLSNIFTNALPEGVNVKNLHPEYFNGNVPSSILITEDAEVSITFIHEGAGYKNVLGYYYYDANNPPTSVDDITKLIAFPNASAEGSGGGLVEGNTVNIVGNFKANTILGFFLNSNGWNNGNITEGYWAHYTDYKFNKKKKRQSVLMYDATCDATVVGFEDIFLNNSNCDKDYNDALFQIRSYPNNAYDVSSFIQL